MKIVKFLNHVYICAITPMKRLFISMLILIIFGLLSSIGNQTILIQPLGNVPAEKIKILEKTLSKFYKTDVVVLKNEEIPNHVKIKNSSKNSADKILLFYNSKYFFSNKKILIVTTKDICTTRFINGKKFKNWGVFGLGTIYGPSCVISTYRIKSTDRLTKVAIHEIGHTKGLSHCETKKCVMNDAKGLGSNVDKCYSNLCDKCSKKINF